MRPDGQDTSGEPGKDSTADIFQSAIKAFEEEEKKDPGVAKRFERLILQRESSDQKFRDQIVEFRKRVFRFLLWMMALETIVLFLIVILNSLPYPILNVDKLTLQILVGATIAQISTMLFVIIRSVFSNTLNKLIMSRKEHKASETINC